MRPLGLAFIFLAFCTPALADRAVVDLSGQGWKLRRDKDAAWRNDTLYLPPVDLAKVPSTHPTIGWDKLYSTPATDVSVPGTVEEYLWGADGSPHGLEGNYQGVSFWWRSFTPPQEWQGKRILLRFAACRQRAEVYLNEQLVGYDAVGNTPFEVDITGKAKLGQANWLVVRITDHTPNVIRNNFDWADNEAQQWGDTSQKVPASHGFGGVTGKVTLLALDAVYINDVFVKNKPSPSTTRPTDADVDIEIANTTAQAQNVITTLRITQRDNPEVVVFEQTSPPEPVKPGLSVLTRPIQAPSALIWDLDHPTLYDCRVSVRVESLADDATSARFGFRWFAPDALDTPDPLLRLNGRRIVLRSAISWGFWPVNGLFPSRELAYRQVQSARALGLNMLSMHRTIGDPLCFEAADELGLLMYAEPGGYKGDWGDATTRALAAEKLFRMIRRDRNHPSIIIWDMVNEIFFREWRMRDEYLRDIVVAHKIDPSRIITLCSGQKTNTATTRQVHADPVCSWMMPYDDQRRESGWCNEHRAGGPGVYTDSFYRSPTDLYGGECHSGWVMYWGEDGAISSPPQLDSLVEDIRLQKRMGWDGDDYLRWHKGWSAWLDAHDARGSFPTINDLARSLGNIAYYYQGRITENCRINNRPDAYVINGWECEKLENHSGIVDCYRRPKGDPAVLAYYNRPLYVAVKARRKIAEPATQVVCDFHLVNERNVAGPHTLEVVAVHESGKTLFRQAYPVKPTGGDVYGELLVPDVSIPIGAAHGYVNVTARLLAPGAVERCVAQGRDEVFVCDYRSTPLPRGGVTVDTGGSARAFLRGIGCEAVEMTASTGPVPFIVIADNPTRFRSPDSLFDRVRDHGTTAVIIGQADRWAAALAQRNLIRYDGILPLGTNWTGGSYFVLEHPLMAGLPQRQGMNWEYQLIQQQRQGAGGRGAGGGARQSLLLGGDEAVVGAFAHHDPRLATAVGIVRLGKGRIILSSLPLLPYLTSDDPAAAVPKRMLVNFIVNSPCPTTLPSTQPATRPATTRS